MDDLEEFRNECTIRGVSYEVISETEALQILEEIKSPSQNMEAVVLEKAPKIAVYSPKDKMPWDDAVTMVLNYAEIPYDVVYDEEVLQDKLLLYEWLHLHHEDFTGQYGKFYGSFRTAPWYIENKMNAEKQAAEMGYSGFKALIDQRTGFPVWTEYTDVDGEPLKRIRVYETKIVGGAHTAMRFSIHNMQTGHTTLVHFTNMRHVPNLDDSVLSSKSLAYGVPSIK